MILQVDTSLLLSSFCPDPEYVLYDVHNQSRLPKLFLEAKSFFVSPSCSSHVGLTNAISMTAIISEASDLATADQPPDPPLPWPQQ
jgi:hypothetical protein